MKQRNTLSVVIPVLNEADAMALLLPQLAQQLHRCRLEWEIVVVDDGGTDALADVVHAFEHRHGHCNVQLLRLSRNFGKEAALSAGLAAARGEGVVCMDGDGQHPAAILPALIAQWQAGNDMVVATLASREHESPLLAWTKRCFYAFLQSSERFRIPPDAGDFRLLDRRVVNALLQLPERSRFMKGLFAWLGYRTATVKFEAAPRSAGRSKFRLRQLFGLATLGITAFSLRPLRMVSGAGALISLAAVAYGAYIAIETLVEGNHVSGWATLASGMMLLSGIQLLCLGVIAEYLGRIYEEAKQRPLYLLDEVTDHSVIGAGARGKQVHG
ncbi:glycosyltransferase family 2 protein [Pseudoduganella violaceinigra]|uniref:glycosyltransferase family 2 protein n=1 Tax=Pseudoduganella violaceinigra TaxID=246602 RepID=UPI000552D017|nr:glycosyltransferase family 2 protein [Pseudoduganella violaceinigra]